MQSLMKVFRSFGVTLLTLLGCLPFAGAQGRLTPIPHPPGYPQKPAVETNAAAPWTPLKNQPSFLVNGAINPVLLMDGTVLIEDWGTSRCWRLTPDELGNFANGTWTKIASMPKGYSPLWHSSAVLPDGRLIVEGGEYLCTPTTCNPVWTNLGAIYDPLANAWTPVTPPAAWTTIGDAERVVLANGTYMQSNCCTTPAALLDPKTRLLRMESPRSRCLLL